jgi:hypothetical protein
MELEGYLQRFSRDGIHVGLVVLDWFGLLMNRAASSSKHVGLTSVARSVTELEISRIIGLSARFQTNFFILHQSDSEAKGRHWHAPPKLTDAADAKNFTDLLHVCISMSSADPKTQIAIFRAVKARGFAQREVMVRRDGDRHRWEIVENLHFNTKMREYMNAEDYDPAEGDTLRIPIEPSGSLLKRPVGWSVTP